MLVVLDYRMGQAPHRLVKLALGLAGMGAITLRPRLGAFVLPVLIPFLDWLPRIPVLNAANLLVFGAFAGWIFFRAVAGQPAVRSGRLGPVLVQFPPVREADAGLLPVRTDRDLRARAGVAGEVHGHAHAPADRALLGQVPDRQRIPGRRQQVV